MNLCVGRQSRLAVALLALAITACDTAPPRADSAAGTAVDSMGVAAAEIRTVPLHSRRGVTEASSAAMSTIDPGVVFIINDSGNDATLFALDTAGADRGQWRIEGAANADWEATAVAGCPDRAAASCVYIGDVGDNDGKREQHNIYRVPEPPARDAAFSGTLSAERLPFRYEQGRPDVEAMYVARNGDVFLITKPPMKSATGSLRPALIFRIGANAWGSTSPATATLVDSLSLVPGSAPLRAVTDASLSPDGRHLAVRTYTQVYVYAVDAASGRVDHSIPAAVCDAVPLGEAQGEGITWLDARGRMVFTTEGREPSLRIASCPLPATR